tara:strand:+ start:178321 stop:178425 length:105 start_codon:yes stop_codon:yes gene_type:complete
MLLKARLACFKREQIISRIIAHKNALYQGRIFSK